MMKAQITEALKMAERNGDVIPGLARGVAQVMRELDLIDDEHRLTAHGADLVRGMR